MNAPAGGTGDGVTTASEQPAVHLSESYDFDAPAEVVYGVLTDPDRTSRWLPRGMNTTAAGAGEIQVEVGEQLHTYAVSTAPDRLELSWRAAEGDGPHGSARVSDAPAGGSVVHADLVVPAGLADEKQVRDLLTETARHLGRDVGDNFNAG